MLRLLLGRSNFASFKIFTQTLKLIQSDPSRISKQRIFLNYLQQLNEQETITIKNLFQLGLEKFSRLEDRSLLKNIDLLDISPEVIEKTLQNNNDVLGAISILFQSKAQNQNLQVQKVLSQLTQLKNTVGKNSTILKFQILKRLLNQCSNQYQRRVILSVLTNNFQIGFNKISINNIFSQIIPSERGQNQQKYECMLTKPLKDFSDVVKFVKDEQIVVQYKFDGERTHIQYKKGKKLQLFSRKGKSQLKNYPDVFQTIQQELSKIQNLQSCILDGQIICVDLLNNATNIQILLNRKASSRQKLNNQYHQKVMVFDVLEKNGKSLIQHTYQQRIKEIPDFSSSKILTNVQTSIFKLPQQKSEFIQFFQRAVSQGYEGLIIKKPKSSYDIKRGRTDWAKLKKGQTQQGTSGRSVDVDLIMMGAFKGKGNRKGVLGSFLFGTLYDGFIYPITKTGTTLTDEAFKQISEQVLEYKSEQIPAQYIIPKGMKKPDIWVRPHLVVEISSQQWTRSPIYSFNSNENGGLSLRFPTFIRVRRDKGIKDSTQGDEILKLIQ